jgi:hypothetical protein
LLFDVSDSSKPKFLSWYRGDECEGVIADVDCGAFVDLSPDGKRVYISVQQISVVPGGSPAVKPGLAAYPGVDVVDISDPTAPSLTQKLPVVSVGGVHTTRSFDVPGKGEYTVSVANSVGAMIHKLDESTGTLTPVGLIEMDELHDTFIQQDPMTGKTLLYIAGGFDSGFYVYDVSDPANPVGLAEWDPTPECADDWYSHTLDVTTVNGRRIVTLPVELIDFFGDQSEADQAQGCGKLAGNGDFAGPLFIVDATDFSKLGAADPVDSESTEEASDMKAKSEATLITTWSNAAGRAGGRLTFSPHNQQIVGNRIYLSAYHAGVTVLDATEAFEGKNVRPKELGVIVPHGDDVRPIHPGRGGTTPAFDQFFTSFISFRPIVWDMQFHNGQVLAADMVGGFYALKLTDDANPLTGDAPAGIGTAGDQVPPSQVASVADLRFALRLTRNRELGRRLRFELKGPGVELVRAVSFRLNGRRVAADLKAPFRRTLTLSRKVVRRKSLRLAARVVLHDGATLTLRRTLRTRLRR